MAFEIKNFTMEQFNNDVNNSGNLQSKYKQWANYRQKIDEFISKSIKNKNSIIVLGAGECNDIDLHFLTSTFGKVTLSDVDAKSIDEGIARQKLNENQISKINIVQADYTGLGKVGFFHELSNMAKEKASCRKICEYINEIIININTDDILSEHKKSYDVVLVCPIYTQLAYTQMEVLLKILYQYNIYPMDDLNKILTAMHYSMPNIIANYNKMLLSLAKDDGKIIALVDILEITDNKIGEIIAANIEDNNFIEEFLLENYSEISKMGLDDLKKRINTIEESYEIWSFDESKQYLVQMMAGETR